MFPRARACLAPRGGPSPSFRPDWLRSSGWRRNVQATRPPEVRTNEVPMNEASTATTLESVDILKLLTLLPHRYPFLLVDRIIEINGDVSAVGIKNVTINEPQFAGHFPEQPVMPGVLLVEAMAQTAGAICVLNAAKLIRPKLVYFMTIDECKFRK